jgi:electron transfer DM13
MTSQKKLMLVGGVIVLGLAWYAFRPERLFINQTVDESFPVDTGSASASTKDMNHVVAAGQFHGVAHTTKGTASIYQLADGKRVLRLTDFETSNGPDVQVYLVAASDASDNEAVTKAGFINVGALKGNMGDQNYDVPADADLSKYRAVTVWCRRFGVNFATAPLAPQN